MKKSITQGLNEAGGLVTQGLNAAPVAAAAPAQVEPLFPSPIRWPGQRKKLVARVQRGEGNPQASISEANRMFRLKHGGAGEQPEARLPARDIRSVEEVTRGLGLDSQRAQQVSMLVGETRADGGAKSQTHRLFLGLDRLNTTLRAMRDVPSETRMEIARRARAYWMNTQQTDYGKEPTVRAPLRPQARENLTMKKSAHGVQKSLLDVLDADPLVKKMTPPSKKTVGAKKTIGGAKKTVGAKGPAKESWSQQRERELNEAYAAKQAAAKSAPKQAAPGAKAGPPKGAPAAPQGAPPAGPPKKGGEDLFAGAAARAAAAAPQPLGAPKPGKAPKGPQMGGASMEGAKGAVSLDTPPPGFTAIPGSAKGGYHKQEGDHFVYWYPGVGITSTAAGEDRPGAASQGPAGAPKAGAAPAAGPQGAKGSQGPAGAPPSVLGMQGPAAGPQGPKGAPGGGAQAGAAQGKEHHRAEHEKHKAAARAAFAAGDNERGAAHRAAAEHHRHSFNAASYAEHGQTWNRGKPPPPMPEQFVQQGAMGVGADPVGESYGRAQSGVAEGEDGERQTAADPRQRHVPESETVKAMREALGKSVNVLADLSAAHDHLASLKAKKKQIAASGHPLARRLVSQCDAEIAATRHDIVQLEDAHGHAMKEVAKLQGQMRSEQIKANPIFRTLMGAFQSLAGMGQKLTGKKGEDAQGAQPGQASEEQPEALGEEPDDESAPEGTAGEDESAPQGPRDQIDLAARRAKALGASEDDGTFDVSAAAKEQQRKQALEAGASPDVLDALDAQGGERIDPAQARNGKEDKAANMQRVLAVLGEEHSPDAPSEADAALADLPKPGEVPEPAAKKPAPKDVEADTGQWDADIAAKRKKIEEAESAEDEALAPYADMSTLDRLKAMGGAWAPGGEAATSPTQAARSEVRTRAKSGPSRKPESKPEKGTLATGPKKKRTPPAQLSEAQKSMIVDGTERLVKSEAFARVLRLAPKVDRMLKAASAPRLVVKRAPRPDLIALYSARV